VLGGLDATLGLLGEGGMESQPTIASCRGTGEEDAHGRSGWRVVPGSLGYGLQSGAELRGADAVRAVGRRRRAMVGGLIATAALLVAIAALAGWGGDERQTALLDTHGLTQTTPQEEEAFFNHIQSIGTTRVNYRDNYKYWSKERVRSCPRYR